MSDKSNYLQSEAAKVVWNKHYESVNVHFGHCSNQVSAGTMEKLWLTQTKTPAHCPRKVKRTSAFSGRETNWLSYAWEDHV